MPTEFQIHSGLNYIEIFANLADRNLHKGRRYML